MRKVLYAALLIPLFFVPLNRVNIADLLPVEGVALYIDSGQATLETDMGNIGTGETVEEALAALKENTPAIIYLDTAEYLLVSDDALNQVESLRPYLKSSVKVCICQAAGQVKNTVQYLQIYGDLPTLKTWEK